VKDEELIEFEQKFSTKEKGKPKIDLSVLDYNFLVSFIKNIINLFITNFNTHVWNFGI
jgi:hypothetical protein